MGKQVAARLKQKNHRISGVDINKRLNSDEIAGMKFLLPDDCSNSQKSCGKVHNEPEQTLFPENCILKYLININNV